MFKLQNVLIAVKTPLWNKQNWCYQLLAERFFLSASLAFTEAKGAETGRQIGLQGMVRARTFWRRNWKRCLLSVVFGGAQACSYGMAPLPAAPTETRCIDSFSQLGVDTPAPHFGWVVNDPRRGELQTAYQIKVASSAVGLAGSQPLWDSGKVASKQQFGVVYAGAKLAKTSEYWWQVRMWDKEGRPSPWSPPTRFVTAFFGASDWAPGCQWIRHPDTVSEATNDPVMFRKDFTLRKPVRKAFLYVTGLGQFVASINGGKVGDHEIDPAWTDYDRTMCYVTFDVASQLKQGANALGIMLGTGWLNGKDNNKIRSFGGMCARLQLHVVYADGATDDIVTDPSWKASRSPWTYTEIHGGENYDARLEQPGWNTAGFSDTRWINAVTAAGPSGELVSQNAPPVVTHRIFPAVSVRATGPDRYLFDIGQNINGQFEITVSGPAGATLSLLPGEDINPDGTLKPTRATGDKYTLRGSTPAHPETWRLTFSSIGFRYLQASGVTRDPAQTSFPYLQNVKGYFTYTAAKEVGRFHASDARYNKIYDLALHTYQSNLVSIHTDGPTYEKLGWQEVVWLSLPSTLYEFDLDTLYTKIMRDLRDAQRTGGLVPDIAPNWFSTKSSPPGNAYDDAPAWGASMFLAPWQIYNAYGDRRILEDNYDAMKAYLAYLKSQEKNGCVTYGLGDWLAPGGRPVPPVEDAVYVLDTHVLGEIAAVLHRTADAKFYTSEYLRVRRAYNDAFFNAATLSYQPMNQTDQALPLAFGIVPEGQEAAVTRALVDDIAQPQEGSTPVPSGKAGDNGPVLPQHITAGDIGTTFVWQVLGDAGENNLVQTMIMQPDGPSYLNMINSGQTTITESWDVAKTRSHNHDMYAGIFAWFYRTLGGISSTKPGYEEIQIKPGMPTGLSSVSCAYESVRGEISSSWEVAGRRVTMRVGIPANTMATIFVPALSKDVVTESGRPIGQAAGVQFLRMDGRYAVFHVGSGAYVFQSGT